ncbi:MAG: hypothetical protein L0170_00420, partial [Acidobacteria bacterium]|nr:hypothetical protein [Acidobacteriota bacterium]
LRQHGSPSIRWRTVNDVLPPGSATEEDRLRLREEVVAQKQVIQITKKQKSTGVWGENILGVAPAKAQGIKDVGTVAQYRRLLELGVPTDNRAFRLADRVLFRLLSRDEDPALMFEYRNAAKGSPEVGIWGRDLMRQGTTAALAQAGLVEDPRVRGAAHRIASEISQYLRSELAQKPLIRKGNRNLLHPEAKPPTILTVAMIAYMPGLQRERAGFALRLCTYLAQPAPKREFVIPLGKRAMKPMFQLLGDPLTADSAGRPKDLALALHWIELLARMGMLASSVTAQRILSRLLADCNEAGVWTPKNLRSLPRSPSKLADFAFPLEADGKAPETRQADVTFRLALIAKFAGWSLEYT